MNNSIDEIINNFLNFRRNENRTSEFLTLKHNKDLVPQFTKNLKSIIKIIGKYSDDCYDIQGISDKGVDVLLKYKKNDSNCFIGLQIKSYDDLNKKDWLSKLKAQLFEAQGYWKMESYYVVFCSDIGEHLDKIRNATSEIVNYSKGKIQIINPGEAIEFYHLSFIEIITTIYRYYHRNDPIFEVVKERLSQCSDFSLSIIIEILVEQFINNNQMSQEEIFSSNFVNLIMEQYTFEKEDDENNLLIDSWQYILDSDLIEEEHEYHYRFKYYNNWGITAFVSEIMARHSISNLKEFIFNTLKSRNKDLELTKSLS